MFESLRCAVNAVSLLKVGDGLHVIDHESAAGQGDRKRFGDGAVGHIDMIPRLSSRSVQAMSARVKHARNTWYVVAVESDLERGFWSSIALMFVDRPRDLERSKKRVIEH